MASTTNYGWETPDDTDLVKDGALAMRTTANSIDSTLGTALNNKLHAGLVLIKTQTIGTAVSSVTVTGAFSATYDHYKIMITGGTASAANLMYLRLGATNTGYYDSRVQVAFNSTSVTGAFNNNTAGLFQFAAVQNPNGLSANIELMSPYASNRTQYHSNWTGFNGSTGEHATNGGYLDNTLSYTDFTFIAGGGTLTGGLIAVYGYAKD